LSLNDFQQTERADAIVSPFFFSPQLLLLVMPEGRLGGGVDKTFVTLFSAPQLLVLGPSASDPFDTVVQRPHKQVRKSTHSAFTNLASIISKTARLLEEKTAFRANYALHFCLQLLFETRTVRELRWRCART
jgi:hypothetical protein